MVSVKIAVVIIITQSAGRVCVTGAKPYPDVKHQDMKTVLQKGHRMDCPADCPPEL